MKTGTVKTVTQKTGQRGAYQSVHMDDGSTFLNSITPFPMTGDKIEYDVKESKGYIWTTALKILSEKGKVDVAWVSLILQYGLEAVQEAIKEAESLSCE